jgi:general secretion pathway protein C
MNSQVSALLTSLPQLQPLYRRLPVFVSLLLVIACAQALVRITWLFLPEAETETTPVRPARVGVAIPGNTGQDIRRLASAHLFGETVSAAPAAPTKALETRLNLVLRGVIAADQMSMSSAIIAQGNSGQEDVYGVGDKLPGGVSVSEVHPEHVMLERGGHLEILRLVKDNEVGEITSSPDELPDQIPGSPGEVLRDIRNNILKNPTSFGEYALPVLVKEGGNQIGYRLEPQQKGSMLAELGLEPQDVITEINGVKLDNPQNGIAALRKLSTSNSINLTVRRNGAEVPLNIQLQ